MNGQQNLSGLEIAIIGISGAFPGSANCSELWENLRNGQDMMTTFSNEELLDRGVPRSLVERPDYVKTMGVLRGKEFFDAPFFGYTDAEARLIDPQIRLFMQHCWSALEDAGATPQIENSKIGLFAGASVNDNWRIFARTSFTDGLVDPHVANVISTHHFIATMVSYKLNLKGPSLFIDTACSTSLVAVHQACRSLLTRDCSIALAGGSTVRTVLSKGYLHQEGLAFSKDGHNRTFDAESTGTGGGEGVGVVVLKRLSDALRDNDHIYAVIKSSSVNNDGNRKVGYGAPSVQGQIECIKTAHKLANVSPENITYIEAHGTATNLGDPIEVDALNQAFNNSNNEKYCAIGSIKTNMGHLDIAAGVTGLIKTSLSLKHRELVPSLFYKAPNPSINFDQGPFFVNTTLQKWHPRNGGPLCAGISAFGVGGTNAHLVLQEPILTHRPNDHQPDDKLLTISAKTETALKKYAEKLRAFLVEKVELNLQDLCYNLSVCRKHFDFRYAVHFQNRDELLKLLDENMLSKRLTKARGNNLKIIFMFSGLGSQYPDMGKELYNGNSVFRSELDAAVRTAYEITGMDYLKLIYPDRAEKNALNAIEAVQPVIFLFEYAIARMMIAYGLEPSCLIGHSTGEYVAACISGVFSFEDAFRLVLKRGQLGMKLPPGAMLACGMNETQARFYVGDKISLAAVNAEHQTILSGDPEAILQLTQDLQKKDISAVRLNAAVAGHSYMLDPLLDEFSQAFRNVTLHEPKIRLVSCVTGDFNSPDDCANPAYWIRHVRQPVLFYNGIQSILAQFENPLFVEIGAGNTLTALLKKMESDEEIKVLNTVRSPRERENDATYLADRFCKLWAFGAPLKWEAFFKPENSMKLSLPSYAFDEYVYPCEVNPAIPEYTSSVKPAVYLNNWHPFVNAQSSARSSTRNFLLVSADHNITDDFALGIIHRGHNVIRVTIGEGFEGIEEDIYTVAPIPADFARVMDICLSHGCSVTDVIYMSHCSSDAALLALFQTLGKNFSATLQRTFVVSNNNRDAAGIGGCVMPTVTQALGGWLGACCPVTMILTDDHPEPNPLTVAATLKTILSDEPLQATSLFIKGNKRITKGYYPVLLNEAIDSWPLLKTHGSYLIIGGLSKPGFILTKFLAGQLNANVTVADLTGWLSQQKTLDPKQQNLASLNGEFKDIRYLTRTAENNTLTSLLNELIDEGCAFDGIIYIPADVSPETGLLGENISLENLNTIREEADKILEQLALLAENGRADFVWTCSSLSDHNGENGFSQNTLAESFLAARIQINAGLSGIWKHVLIDDSLFRNNQEVTAAEPDFGMAAEEYFIKFFIFSISEDWDGPLVQSDINFSNPGPRRRKVMGKNQHDPQKHAFTSLRKRPDLNEPYAPPESPTEKKIQYLFENILNMDRIGVLDDFFEIGGDSLQGMLLLKRIGKEFKTELVIRDFFQKPCIRAIAEEIEKKTGESVNEADLNNEITI